MESEAGEGGGGGGGERRETDREIVMERAGELGKEGGRMREKKPLRVRGREMGGRRFEYSSKYMSHPAWYWCQ